MEATMTIAQLITIGNGVDFQDTGDMADWLAKCYRVCQINDHPEVVESSWIGLAKIDSLTARRQYKETVMAQLKAIDAIDVDQ